MLLQAGVIDHEAVSWPGEIDLAPDAMYAEVSGKPTEAELSPAYNRHSART
jgi:hypothetical protein